MAYLKKHMIVHQYPVCDMERQLKIYEYDGVTKNPSQVPVSYKPILPELDQRRLHHIREIYYQQRECLSAYQLMHHRSVEDNNKRYFLLYYL